MFSTFILPLHVIKYIATEYIFHSKLKRKHTLPNLRMTKSAVKEGGTISLLAMRVSNNFLRKRYAFAQGGPKVTDTFIF